MAGVFAFFGRVVREALIVLGLLVVVVVVGLWWKLSGDGGPGKAGAVPAAVVPAVGVVAAGDPVAGVVGAGCPCSAGLVCEGPKGGKFCVTDDGRKRYK